MRWSLLTLPPEVVESSADALAAELLAAPELVQPFGRGGFPGCVRVTSPRSLKPLHGPLRWWASESTSQDLVSMFSRQPPIHFKVDPCIPVSEVQKRSQEISQSFAATIRSQAEMRQVPEKGTTSAGQAVPALQEGEFRQHFCRS